MGGGSLNFDFRNTFAKRSICCCQNKLESLACRSPFFAPKLTCEAVRTPFSTLISRYCWSFLPLVSKLKPTSPCYLPYLNIYPGVIVPRVDPARRADIVRFLKLGWHPGAIAKHLYVSKATVYNTEQNLMRYGLLLKPCVRKTGRPAALTKADRVALLKLLLNKGWKYLDEL